MIEFVDKNLIGKKATQVCPCGYLGDPSGPCSCPSEQIAPYKGKISDLLLDQINIHLEVAHEVLRRGFPDGEESSDQIRIRVISARNLAITR